MTNSFSKRTPPVGKFNILQQQQELSNNCAIIRVSIYFTKVASHVKLSLVLQFNIYILLNKFV